MQKLLLIFFLFIFTFSNVKATPQEPDILIYNGDTIPIFSNPLEVFLQLNGKANLDRGCNPSTCNRGYIATWTIKNDSLFLVNIRKSGIQIVSGVFTGVECSDSIDSELFSYLRILFKSKPFFVGWYSDTIISPQGRILKYVHGGYLTKYERELLLEIDNGLLRNIETVKNSITDPQLINQFNYNLIHDTLFHYISKMDWSVLGEKFCDYGYAITVSKNGKILKVKSDPEYSTAWENFIDNYFLFRNCRKEIKKGLKELNFKEMLLYEEKKKRTIVVDLNWNEKEQQLEFY
jgi:hypothetical protein